MYVETRPDLVRIADNMEREYPNMTRECAMKWAQKVLDDIAAKAKGFVPPDVPNPYANAIPVKTSKATVPVRADKPVDEFQQGLIEAFNATESQH